MPKTIKPWRAVRPGDRYASRIPTGWEVPEELIEEAAKAGVIEPEAEEKLSPEDREAVLAALQVADEDTITDAHKKFVGRARGKAGREKALENIAAALAE